MDQQEILTKTIDFVKETMIKESAHDFYHIMRVYHLALYLGEKEHANLFIVSLASLLHDIADHKFHHGDTTVGGKIAENWLNQCGVSEAILSRVVRIVETLSFKSGTNKVKQETIEGKVVQDADRLDAIGAIGIARTFSYGGFKNRALYVPKDDEIMGEPKQHSIHHFYEKLLLLKDLMNTKTGARIAKKRHEYMEGFLNQFYKEWDGLDFE